MRSQRRLSCTSMSAQALFTRTRSRTRPLYIPMKTNAITASTIRNHNMTCPCFPYSPRPRRRMISNSFSVTGMTDSRMPRFMTLIVSRPAVSFIICRVTGVANVST